MQSFFSTLFRLGVFCLIFISENSFSQNSNRSIPADKLNFNGFLLNKGQVIDAGGNAAWQVLAEANLSGLQLFITDKGITYLLSKKATKKNDEDSTARFDVNLLGAKISAAQIETDEKINQAPIDFYLANCQNGLNQNFVFKKIKIKNIYEGVDWIWIFKDSTLEYSFELQKGTNPAVIKLQYVGFDTLLCNDKNELLLKNRFAEFKEIGLKSFQQDELLSTNFIVQKKNIVSYAVKKINQNKSLTIDPTIIWSTNFGGTNCSSSAITVNKNDELIVTGRTTANSNFPIFGAGSYFSWTAVNSDYVYVSKFSKNLQLLWSLIYGGTKSQAGLAVEADNANNIFVTGYTNSADFPVHKSSGSYYDSVLNDTSVYAAVAASYDAFLLKFNNNGARIFSTFIGGNSYDYGNDLAIDAAGNAVLSGNTYSSTFPLQTYGSFNQSTMKGTEDGFICKFNNNGARLWSSYFGGNNLDKIYSITTDLNSNIFITGATTSDSLFPLLNNGGYFKDTINQTDIFITKFSASGNLQWSTLYGGSAVDIGSSVIADHLGDVYVTANTYSKNIPCFRSNQNYFSDTILNNSTGSTYYSFSDLFVLKFSTNGTRLWGTYLGGEGNDYFGSTNTYSDYHSQNNQLSIDKCNNIYLNYYTQSLHDVTLNMQCNSYFSNVPNNSKLVKFDRHCVMKWNTYYYPTGESAITVDSKANLYVMGNGSPSNNLFPTTYGFPFAYYSNAGNMVLSRLDYSAMNAGVNYSMCSASPCSANANVIINSACALSGFAYLWSNGSTTTTANNLCAGNQYVILTDTALTCATDTIRFKIKQGFQAYPQFSAQACPTTCNGIASVNIPNLSNGLQYQWHVNDTIIKTVATVFDLCPEQDTLIVTSTGCGADTVIFNIQQYPFIYLKQLPVISGHYISCPLICDWIGKVLVTGGQKAPTITWSNGVTGTVDSTMCVGNTYTVTATDSVCYYTSAVFSLPTYPISCNIRDLTAYNGYTSCKDKLGAYINGTNQNHLHYHWNTGDSTQFIYAPAGATYSCTITDSCGSSCTATYTMPPFTIQSFNLAFDGYTQPTHISLCDGTLSYLHSNFMQIFRGFPPYLWYLNGVLIDTTNSFSFTFDSICCNKNYHIKVIDACGDTGIANYNTTCGSGGGGGATYGFGYCQNTCGDSCNYRVTISTTFGSPPYQWYWFDGKTTAGYHDSLCANGNYWVLLTNTIGQQDLVNFTVPNRPFRISVNYQTGSTVCCKGSFNATPSCTKGPVTYLWGNGATTPYVNNYCVNTPNWVIATDGCGRKDTAFFTIPVVQPPTFGITVTPTASCNNLPQGSATASINNPGPGNPYPIAPFTYTWSNGASGVNVYTTYNLNAGQTVTCTVTDFCGTTATANAVIPTSAPLALQMGSSPSCINGCNGIAYAYPNSGTPPYTYYWGGNVGVNNFLNACAGKTYTCKVVDACGDSAINSVSIPTLPQLTATITTANTVCNFNCSATATVSYSGGMAPYYVAWSTGLLNSNTLQHLCTDSLYTCLVSSLGCRSKRIKFRIPSNPVLKSKVLSVDSSCANNCSGKIKITGLNGVPPYTYHWNNGATTPLITGLCSGIYTGVVKDFCSKTDSIQTMIFANAPLHGYLINQKNSCKNVCNGTATIAATGGSKPYTFLWSNSQTASTATNLCGGANYCIVIDSCGARDTVRFSINEFAALKDTLIITQPIGCINTCQGAAYIVVRSGKPPYTYLWSNGDTNASTSTLCVGNNFCIVNDSCGFHDTLKFKIDSIAHLSATTNFNNSACLNICTGTASTVVSGGQSPYHFVWNNGDTTSSIHHLCPGIYSVIITNPFCISDTIFDTMKIHPTFIATAHTIAVSPCHDSCKGIAQAFATGGIQPYNYLWSNGIKSALYNKFCADTFAIKITDSVGCMAFDTIVITQPPPMQVSSNITTAHCFNPDGAASVQASGTTSPYAYTWDNGVHSSINNNIVAGYHTVIVEDSNHCKVPFYIFVGATYPKVFVSNDTTIGTGDSTRIHAYGTLKYFWYPSSNLNCDTCRNAIWTGFYPQDICVIGTDSFGCADTSCMRINTFDDCGDIYLPNAFTPNGDKIDDTYLPISKIPECFTQVVFKIYDRWGILLFQADNLTTGWDGTYKNQPMPIETYVWYLNATNYFGRKIFRKGDVILLR